MSAAVPWPPVAPLPPQPPRRRPDAVAEPIGLIADDGAVADAIARRVEYVRDDLAGLAQRPDVTAATLCIIGRSLGSLAEIAQALDLEILW